AFGSGTFTWLALDANEFYTTPDGAHWYAEGRIAGATTADDGVLVYDGTVVLREGRAIPGTNIIVGDITQTVLAGNGDWISRGRDWVIVGRTDSTGPAADEVIVLNGEQVVLREGDPVDLDGNGVFDDDAFIGRGVNTNAAFNANTWYLTDDRVLYGIVMLRNS